MKKKIKIVISILSILTLIIILGIQFLLTRMSERDDENLTKEELKTVEKYSEWIDEIKLLNNEKIKFIDFDDTDIIKVHVSENSFEELEDVLDRDANFIESNPSYFKAGQKRVLYEQRSSSSYCYFVVSNTFDFGLRLKIHLNFDIPYTKDGGFRITYIPYEKFTNSINKKNTEVLILNIRCFYNTFNYSDYTDRNSPEYKKAISEYKKNKQLEFPIDLLKEYSSLKYVVLQTYYKEEELSLIIKNIKQACPSVKIYMVDDSDEENSSNK